MTTMEQQLRSLEPSGTPPRFADADVCYAVTETEVGRILLALNDSGALVMSRYVADDEAEAFALDRLSREVSPRVLRLPGHLDAARRQLDDYLHGSRRGFDLPVDLSLTTPFQRSVLTTLAGSVGYGQRATYGALAASIRRPTASRAVGRALGTNPLCIVLPCHRVVGASGSLTGYAGGVGAKQFLLDLESAQ